MRGARSHWTLLTYVLVLSVVLFGVYFIIWNDATNGGGIANWAQRKVGQEMFIALTWVQMVLLALIGPSLTAGALTLEYEQQTIEMLSLTSLSTRNIVAGKAGAAVLYLWMLLASSLPLAGMCFVFGGISVSEVLVSYLLLGVWCLLGCTVGVFWSSMLTKTSMATLATYGHTPCSPEPWGVTAMLWEEAWPGRTMRFRSRFLIPDSHR
jgi:ABC-2 type transport system permease protein